MRTIRSIWTSYYVFWYKRKNKTAILQWVSEWLLLNAKLSRYIMVRTSYISIKGWWWWWGPHFTRSKRFAGFLFKLDQHCLFLEVRFVSTFFPINSSPEYCNTSVVSLFPLTRYWGTNQKDQRSLEYEFDKGLFQ